MDIQLVITYFIIITTVGYVLYHLYKVIKPTKKSSTCGRCPSCKFKKEIIKNSKAALRIQPIKNK